MLYLLSHAVSLEPSCDVVVDEAISDLNPSPIIVKLDERPFVLTIFLVKVSFKSGRYWGDSNHVVSMFVGDVSIVSR